MQEEIKKLHRDFNLTTIFVTHDQVEAFKMADDVIIITDGKIIDRGSPQKIYNNPANEKSLAFIGQKNITNDMYVRPEKIEISNSGEEFIIKDIIFMGSTIELLVSNEVNNLRVLVINNNFDKKIGESIKLKYKMEKI